MAEDSETLHHRASEILRDAEAPAPALSSVRFAPDQRYRQSKTQGVYRVGPQVRLMLKVSPETGSMPVRENRREATGQHRKSSGAAGKNQHCAPMNRLRAVHSPGAEDDRMVEPLSAVATGRGLVEQSISPKPKSLAERSSSLTVRGPARHPSSPDLPRLARACLRRTAVAVSL